MGNNDQRSGGSSSNNNSSSSSSGKKGKNKSSSGNSNSNNSEKPKQPQRGLGVAQLEKIRLHSQMASCGFLSPPPPHHHHQYPLHPSFPHPHPHPFQHVQEDMRIQGGYQHLHSSFGYSSPSIGPPSSFAYPPNFMMGMGDHMERAGNMRYGESQPCTTPRWNPNNNFGPVLESQHYMQPPGMVTRHLLSNVEQQNNGINGIVESMGRSNGENSESSETEELDLELKL